MPNGNVLEVKATHLSAAVGFNFREGKKTEIKPKKNKANEDQATAARMRGQRHCE